MAHASQEKPHVLEENDMLEQLQSIFEQLPLGVALVDAITGRVYQINSKFIEIFGNCGQLDLVRLKKSDLLAQSHEAWERLLAGKSNDVLIDKAYQQPDGSTFRIRIKITVCAKSRQRNPCLLWFVEEIGG